MSDNENKEQDEIYSKKIFAGKRSYFFDIKKSRTNDSYYLTITESIKVSQMGEKPVYKKHRVIVYPEDFNKFLHTATETIEEIKKTYMPNFEYDKFDNV